MKILSKPAGIEDEQIKDWIYTAMVYEVYEAGGRMEFPAEEANVVGEMLNLSVDIQNGKLILETTVLGTHEGKPC